MSRFIRSTYRATVRASMEDNYPGYPQIRTRLVRASRLCYGECHETTQYNAYMIIRELRLLKSLLYILIIVDCFERYVRSQNFLDTILGLGLIGVMFGLLYVLVVRTLYNLNVFSISISRREVTSAHVTATKLAFVYE